MGDMFEEMSKNINKPVEARVSGTQSIEITGNYVDIEFDKIFKAKNNIGPVMSENQAQTFKQEIKKYLERYLTKFREAKIKQAEELKKEELDEDKDSKLATELSENKKQEEKTDEEKKKEAEHLEKEKEESEEKEEEDPNKKTLEEKEEDTKSKNANNIGYLDRIEMLRVMNKDIQEEQITEEKYCANEKDYYNMLLFKKILESDSEEYEKDLNAEAAIELRNIKEKNKTEEIKRDAQIIENFEIKVDKLEALNNELMNLNKELETLYQDMESEKIDVGSDYNEKVRSLNNDIMSKTIEVQKLNPKELKRQSGLRKEQEAQVRSVMGIEYESKVKEDATPKMQNALEKEEDKEKKQEYNVIKESEFNEKETLQKTLTIHKTHQENLENKLATIPLENTLERAPIVEEIIKTKVNVASYSELVDKIDRNSIDASIDIQEAETEIEMETEKVTEDFKPLNDYIEKEEIATANEIVADPTENQKEAEAGAKEYLTEQSKITESVIPGLELQIATNDDIDKYYYNLAKKEIENPEQAQEALKGLEEKSM